MVHIAESTVGRRYAGWFIRNTERTQKIYDDLRHAPLPGPLPHKPAAAMGGANQQGGGEGGGGGGGGQHHHHHQERHERGGGGGQGGQKRGGQKVAWGGVKT